jgi:hypothetical protein
VSKFARLTVKVPIDDALPVRQLIDHLRDALEERGIEVINLRTELNGEEMMLAEAPKKARIYWPASEVLMSVERPPKEPVKANRRKEAA